MATDAVSSSGIIAESAPPSRVPGEWIPERTIIDMLLRRVEEGHWVALLPEFSIAGRGDSFDEAAVDAMAALEEYLLRCKLQGKSFVDCRRPVRASDVAAILAGQFIAAAIKAPRIVPRLEADRAGT